MNHKITAAVNRRDGKVARLPHSEDRWKEMNLDSPLAEVNRAPHEPVRSRKGCDVTPTHGKPKWTLKCPGHSCIKLAERQSYNCGTFVFHPVCPICLQDEILRDSSDAMDHLDILISHYDSIFQAYGDKSSPLRRLISELKDLREDIDDVFVDIDLADFDKRLKKALLEIEGLVKGKPRSSKPTILEQIRSLSDELSSLKEKLSKVSKNTSDQYKSNLVGVTNDVLSQLVNLDLTSRQNEILECGDPTSVFVEFEKLQKCMIEVTKALSIVSSLRSKESRNRGKSKNEPSSKSTKTVELKPRKRKCLDAIPECISLESSSHSGDGALIREHFSNDRPGCTPSDDLQSDWDQLTVFSSSCSSTEGGMSVLNIVRRLKNSEGCDMSTLTYLECIDDWCLKDDVQSVEFAAAGGIPAIIESMRVATSSLDIQTKACETLKYLASNKSNLPLIVVVGGITSVLTAMSRYPNNIKLQTVALGALKHLSAHQDTRTEIVMDDGVDVILSAMQRHQGHSTIQRHAIAILETLEWIEIDPVAVSALFACIRRHTREGQLQAHALSVLRRLLDTSTDEEKGARNAIEEILSVLERRVASKSLEFLQSLPNVQTHCSKSFKKKNKREEIVLPNPFNLKGNSEAPGRLISKTWRNRVQVQEKTVAIAYPGPDESLDSILVPERVHNEEDSLFELTDMINEVLIPIEQYMTYPVVQQFGLNTLSILIADEASACAFLRTNGTSVVVESMSEHERETDIQEIGCSLLSDLTSVDEFREILYPSEIRRVALLALENHCDHKNICRWATVVLETLSSMDENKEAIVQEGGIDRLLSAMKEHKDDTTIMESGIGALWELSFDYSCGETITEANGIDIIMAALLLHPYCEAIQQTGYDVLSHIVRDDPMGQTTEKQINKLFTILREYISQAIEETPALATKAKTVIRYRRWLACLSGMLRNGNNGPIMHSCGIKIVRILAVRSEIQQALITSRTPEAVMIAMRTYPTYSILQIYGCGFICDMSGNKQLLKPLAFAGAIASIVSSMKSHQDNVGVQQPACAALCNLASDGEVRREMATREVIQIALDSMKVHSKMVSIHEDCCGLLCNLASDDLGRHPLVFTAGIAQILASMTTFQDEALLQSDGCGALLSIIKNQDDIDDDLLIEMTDMAGAAMVLHKHNQSVQYYGQQLLDIVTQLLASCSSSSSSSL